MIKKQMSKLNLQKFIQSRPYAEKFDTFDVSDETQVRAVITALKKKLKEEPEVQVLFL